MTTARHHTGTLIIGGGSAGCATALRLAQQGQAVTVVERSAFLTPRVGEVLLPAAEGLLRSLDLWERFEQEQFEPSTGIVSVWGSAVPTASSFLYQPFSQGWNLDRRRFDQMILEACRDRGCHIIMAADSISIQRHGRFWNMSVGRQHVRADVVVDATGRAASVASRMGARRVVADRLMAVVGYAPADDDSTYDPRLLVEAVASGWWYSAVLPENRIVVAFLTDADMLPKRVHERGEMWQRLLHGTTQTIGRIATAQLCQPLHLVRANTSRLNRVCGPGWFAVGDAAIALDPLSGNGIIRAIHTGIAAAEAILAGSSASALRSYAGLIQDIADNDANRRCVTYQREGRWDHPFWHRRRHVAFQSSEAATSGLSNAPVLPQPTQGPQYQ